MSFLDPVELERVGRFMAAAAPWVSLGANCLPCAPGSKAPAIAGWGRKGELAQSWGFEPAALHSVDSPKIPVETYIQWASEYRDYNVLVFPATIGAFVVDVDDITLLDLVLEACGDTAIRTISGRPGGGVHLWYRGVSSSQNNVIPMVDIKGTGGYVIAPGSIHRTGAEYDGSQGMRDFLSVGKS